MGPKVDRNVHLSAHVSAHETVGCEMRMSLDRKRSLKKSLDGWLAERGDSFGTIEQLPSGRLRVRYAVGDARFSAPSTYDSLTDARAWLEERRRAVRGGFWVDPRESEAQTRQALVDAVTGNELFDVYMAEGDLKPRTRALAVATVHRTVGGTCVSCQVDATAGDRVEGRTSAGSSAARAGQ